MHEDCAATKTWVSQINKYFLNKIKKKTNKQGDRWEKKNSAFCGSQSWTIKYWARMGCHS